MVENDSHGLKPTAERAGDRAPGAIAEAGPEPAPGGLAALADMPRDRTVDVPELARLLGRCEKTIHEAIRRRELPAPFKLLGRQTWTVKGLLDHFQSLQTKALKAAGK